MRLWEFVPNGTAVEAAAAKPKTPEQQRLDALKSNTERAKRAERQERLRQQRDRGRKLVQQASQSMMQSSAADRKAE